MFLRERGKVAALVGLVTVLGLAASACGDDDGAAVRETGPGACGSASGSGSGSGSGSASGSGSGSGSGSASGSGCGSGSGSGSAASASGGGEDCVFEGNTDAEPSATVEVALAEFALAPTPDSIEAGTIEFVATNNGEEPHEVVVVRYDGDPADMPVDDDGAVDESQLPDGAVIGEIEGFAAGHECAATFELEAGDYVLLCNIVEEEEDGTMEAHFHEGMYTTFTVT